MTALAVEREHASRSVLEIRGNGDVWKVYYPDEGYLPPCPAPCPACGDKQKGGVWIPKTRDERKMVAAHFEGTLAEAHEFAKYLRPNAEVRVIESQPQGGTRTMAPKADKQDRNEGVPKVYLNEKGRFQVGKDARYKSDLVKSALGIEDDDMLHKFSKADAEKRLAARGWTKFLDRKREIIAAKAKAKDEKAAQKKAAKEVQAKAEAATETADNGEATGGLEAQVAAEEAAHVDELAAKREAQPDPKPAAKKSGGRKVAKRS